MPERFNVKKLKFWITESGISRKTVIDLFCTYFYPYFHTLKAVWILLSPMMSGWEGGGGKKDHAGGVSQSLRLRHPKM